VLVVVVLCSLEQPGAIMTTPDRAAAAAAATNSFFAIIFSFLLQLRGPKRKK
jgi:hypothetical protein